MDMFTSFSPNEERFGFSEKGFFYCSYKAEYAIKIVSTIICAAILLGVVIFFVIYQLSFSDYDVNDLFSKMMHSMPTHLSLYLISVSIIIADIAIYMIIIGIVKAGQKYSYHATESSFTIYPPNNGSPIVINYNDVKGVMYEERKFFFSDYGYYVTIITKEGCRKYSYVHSARSRKGGYKGTPFYIISERSALINKTD